MNDQQKRSATEKAYMATLLKTKEWKIERTCERRFAYDKRMKSENKRNKRKPKPKEVPYFTRLEPDFMRKSSLEDSDPQSIQQLTVNEMEAVTRSMNTTEESLRVISNKNGSLIKDERLKLHQLSYDKSYFKRLLLDENTRMLYLRTDNLSDEILNKLPQIKLLSEAITNDLSIKSRKLRMILKREIHFLDERYDLHKKIDFWQDFENLNMASKYQNTIKMALKRENDYNQLHEDLDFTWKLYANKSYEEVENITNTIIPLIKKWPDKDIMSRKFKILADLYYLRGLSLMHLHRYDSAYNSFRKDKDIGISSSLKISIERSQDNLGRIEAHRGNYREAIGIWSIRLDSVTKPGEKAWLYYGISQCYALLGNLDEAISMSQMCIDFAMAGNSLVWELNGNILLANYSAILGMTKESGVRMNTLVSLKAIGKAYNCAMLLANSDVIFKLLEISRHVYNTFKDIDITMLISAWPASLLNKVMNATTAEHIDPNDIMNNNTNNITGLTSVEDPLKENIRKCSQLYQFEKTNQNRKSEESDDALSTIHYKSMARLIVSVNIDDLSTEYILKGEKNNNNRLMDSASNYNVSTVEVIIPSEYDDVDDAWISDSDSSVT